MDETQALTEVTQLLDEVQVRLDQIRVRISTVLGEVPPAPQLSTKHLARVTAVGEVAYRHAEFIAEHGMMTLGDSLSIRREMYGDNVRSTANLFGRKGSGALFYRVVDDYGSPRDDAQEIRLTEEGARIARLWKELNG